MKFVSNTAIILSAMLLLSSCGGAKTTVQAAQRAKDEEVFVEVALDRVEDAKLLQQQLDDLILRSPIAPDAPWVSMVQAIPADRAMAITSKLQSQAPYDQAGSKVPPSKIFAVYNEDVINSASTFIGTHLSFMVALEGLQVPEASKIRNKYEGVKANKQDIASLEGEIGNLEAERDLDTTTTRRQAAIASQLERLQANLASLEERNKTAEDALFQEVAALKARGMLGPEAQPLARSLFYVAQHVATMEKESAITSRLVIMQLVRAIPDLPNQLSILGRRLLGDVMTELGQPVAAAQNASITVEIVDGSLRVAVSGLQQVDPVAVQQSLGTRLTTLMNAALAAPGAAASQASMATFEYDFFKALAEALGSCCGLVFTDQIAFPVPAVSAGTSFGMGMGAGTGQPGAGTAQPGMWGSQPGAGTAQPGMGTTQPGMGTTQPGMGTTQPGMGTTQPGMGTTQPGMGTTQPVPPAPVPTPPPAQGCPAALCGGPITNTSFAQIRLGMTGQETAKLTGRRIAPKTDADHRKPTADVDGVYISFCNAAVCRLETTVRPPATPAGLGVGDKLSSVAKKYGQSKCAPIDSKRFALEFENLPGIFWISDKLDCEGIEDLDYWDRPCKGNVTSVIITGSGN